MSKLDIQEELYKQYKEQYEQSRKASEEFEKAIPKNEYGIQKLDGKPNPIPRFHSGSFFIDQAAGGGVPRGRIIEIFGPESSGKTTLATHMVAEMQKCGQAAMYIDVEHAFDPEYAANIGVDTAGLTFSQPDTGEDALELCEQAVSSGKYGIIVVDSVAALTPKAEIEGEMGDTHVGLQARLMSQAMRKLRGLTQPNDCTIIFINQIRMKIGVQWGSPETTSGGRALRFYASIRMDIRYTGKVKDGDEVIGNKIRVRMKKNKTAPPFKEAETVISYGIGINRNKEMLDIATQAGVIDQRGSWYSLIRPSKEVAKKWMAIRDGLDPENDDFEPSLDHYDPTEDDLDSTIAQGEASVLRQFEENPGLYKEVMERALEWWRENRW